MHPLTIIAVLSLLNNHWLTYPSPTMVFPGTRVDKLNPRSLFLSSLLYHHDDSPCSNPKGQVLSTFMDSEIYKAPVNYSIYLPPCYGEELSNRYPVIYLLHGQTYNNQQWVQLGVGDIADTLIINKQLAPLIIIMPNDPDWRQPGESPFGRMLVDELVPHVDDTYLTRAERQYRAIGGLSRGASWALHLGLTDWDLFSKIGAHSLPIFANDNNELPGWLAAIPKTSIPQIYIDTGNQDPELNVALNFERLLSKRHIPHAWHLFTGAHDQSYWAAHIGKYLLWYACDWPVLLYN
jgi:enterochelin esterase-like enzyme